MAELGGVISGDGRFHNTTYYTFYWKRVSAYLAGGEISFDMDDSAHVYVRPDLSATTSQVFCINLHL